jgi:hypothetical protein
VTELEVKDYSLEMMVEGEGQKAAVMWGTELQRDLRLFSEECLVTKTTVHEGRQLALRMNSQH